MRQTAQAEWFVLVEGQVYLVEGSGVVTTALLHQIDGKFCDILETSSHALVHLIFNTSSLFGLPPLNEVRKIRYPLHPHMGYSITINVVQNPLIRFVVGMAVGISGSRWKDVSSLEEGYRYLIEKDPSLPPLDRWSLPPGK